MNVWFVKWDTPCVTYIFIVYYLSHLSPLSLHAAFHTDLALPPLTQRAHLLLLNHETLLFSLHGQCSTCNNVDYNNAVFTLLLNLSRLGGGISRPDEKRAQCKLPATQAQKLGYA